MDPQQQFIEYLRYHSVKVICSFLVGSCFDIRHSWIVINMYKAQVAAGGDDDDVANEVTVNAMGESQVLQFSRSSIHQDVQEAAEGADDDVANEVTVNAVEVTVNAVGESQVMQVSQSSVVVSSH